MKKCILLISIILFSKIAISDCQLSAHCRPKISPQLGNLDSFEQLIGIEFLECSAKYGRLPCKEQSRLILSCHQKNNESKDGAIENCKIGKKIGHKKSFHLPQFRQENLEEILNDPILLSHILKTNIKRTKNISEFESSKNISALGQSVKINNRIKLKKIDKNKYNIISDHYSSVFVYSDIDVTFDPKTKNLTVSANSYLKQSAVNKLNYIPFSNQFIKSQISSSFNRLEKSLDKL